MYAHGLETPLTFQPESAHNDLEERQGGGGGRTVLSVNFFYTDEFEWVTADPEGYVNALVAYANVGYLNSDLDMEIEVFCISRLPFLSERDNGAELLELVDMLAEICL